MTNDRSTVLVFKTNGMGSTDDQGLKERLAAIFLNLLADSDPLPNGVCFYTDGVKLVVEGSPVLEQLQALEQRGVRLIICRTCLEAFGLLDRVKVGIVGGMPDILEAMWRADKVIAV